MNTTTVKLIRSLQAEGKYEIADAVRDLHIAVEKWEQKVNALTGNYLVCPNCSKKVTDKDEQNFLTHNGECLTCDHVRSDLGGNDA